MSTKPTIANYLKQDSKSLGVFFAKLQRLQLWNSWLNDCLTEEKTLLEHCQITRLDKNSLIVVADNPHWVTRFRFFIPALLVKLKKFPDFANVNAICCKVRPPLYPNRLSKNKTKPQTISTENAEMLREDAKKIRDPKLRAAMEKLAENAK